MFVLILITLTFWSIIDHCELNEVYQIDRRPPAESRRPREGGQELDRDRREGARGLGASPHPAHTLHSRRGCWYRPGAGAVPMGYGPQGQGPRHGPLSCRVTPRPSLTPPHAGGAADMPAAPRVGRTYPAAVGSARRGERETAVAARPAGGENPAIQLLGYRPGRTPAHSGSNHVSPSNTTRPLASASSPSTSHTGRAMWTLTNRPWPFVAAANTCRTMSSLRRSRS